MNSPSRMVRRKRSKGYCEKKKKDQKKKYGNRGEVKNLQREKKDEAGQ